MSIWESLGNFINPSTSNNVQMPNNHMYMDSTGTYNTSFLSPEQWQQFGSLGGTVNNAGQLILNGENVTNSFGNQGSNSLGQFGQGVNTALGVANLAQSLFGLANIGNVRKAAKQQMKINDGIIKGQEFALNSAKEDRAQFKADRKAITDSYNTPSTLGSYANNKVTI